MPVTRRACPTCHHSLCLTQELPARVQCIHCGTSFIAPAQIETAPSRKSGPYPVAAPFARPPATTQPIRPANRLVLAMVLGGVALFVLLGIILLVVCLAGGDPQAENAGSAPPITPSASTSQKSKKVPGTTLKTSATQEKKFAAGKTEAKKDIKPPEESANPDGPPKLTIKVIETVTREKVTTPRRLRLAVTPPKYDNMGQLLNSLGAGYKWTALNDADLRSSNRLADFDVVFFTCSTTPRNDRELSTALRAFVENGGTLYASDLRFTALQEAFPEFLIKIVEPDSRFRFKIAEVGAVQELTAHITDGGLREAMGSDEIKLKFDAYGWKPASFDRAKVTVFLEGWYVTGSKRKAFAPLLVRFNCGKGTVIFTSFHNSAQNSETEQKLLRYLVFTAVTSEIERKVATTMISGGFSPGASRRLATSPDQPKVTQTYTHTKAGPLRFALGFANQGALLRLTLITPDGRTIEKEGSATFTIEVANAPAGEWRYIVTALHVPFPNFPFTLTVGELRS